VRHPVHGGRDGEKTGDRQTALPVKEEGGDMGGQEVRWGGILAHAPSGDRRGGRARQGARHAVDTAVVAIGPAHGRQGRHRMGKREAVLG
jgi:hypothetical protein